MEGRKSRKRRRRQQNKEDKMTLDSENDTAIDANIENGETLCSQNGGAENHTGDKKTESGTISKEDIAKKLAGDSKVQTHANGSHRAGYDAFMTGFIYAVYLHKACLDSEKDKIEERKNKLYLSGKDYPMSICKSSFMKQSKTHLSKIQKIRTLQGNGDT